MRSVRLGELRELLQSPAFGAWWSDWQSAVASVREARVRQEDLLSQSELMALRSELAQRAAVEAFSGSGEAEDDGTRCSAEAQTLENRALELVGEYEEQRFRTSDLWVRLGGAEKTLEERRAAAAGRPKEGQRPRGRGEGALRDAERQHQLLGEEYAAADRKRARLWEEVEAAWAASFERSLVGAEHGLVARRIRRDAERLFAEAEERRARAKQLAAEADAAGLELREAEARQAALLGALALGASALSNFPRDTGGRISQQATGVTLGGAPAVVVPAGEKVVAFRGDGSGVPGFPIALGAGEAASGPAAAADMDGDGRPEIAIATTSGRLFLWSGGPVPGFPIVLGAHTRAGASFGDVDGDGRPEVLVGDEKGRVHAFKRSGREAAGWPSAGGSPVTSSISSAVFGGVRVVAFGCEDGKVHVLDQAGRERPGFPLATKFSVTGAPAFADVDDDGEMDLVVASQDFGVYVVSSRGQPLPGFPVKAGYRIYEGPAVADLDGDGRLDIVFASADGMIHAVNGKGEPLPGFPVRVGVRLFSGPAVADLDRDGALDVVAVGADGSVAAFGANGKPLAGFPFALPGTAVGASPLVYA